MVLPSRASFFVARFSQPDLRFEPQQRSKGVTVTLFQKSRQSFASIDEVATYLGISPVTIRRRIRGGKLPATRIGKQIRIKWSDVEALIAGGKIIPDSNDQQGADLDGND